MKFTPEQFFVLFVVFKCQYFMEVFKEKTDFFTVYMHISKDRNSLKKCSIDLKFVLQVQEIPMKLFCSLSTFLKLIECKINKCNILNLLYLMREFIQNQIYSVYKSRWTHSHKPLVPRQLQKLAHKQSERFNTNQNMHLIQYTDLKKKVGQNKLFYSNTSILRRFRDLKKSML